MKGSDLDDNENDTDINSQDIFNDVEELMKFGRMNERLQMFYEVIRYSPSTSVEAEQCFSTSSLMKSKLRSQIHLRRYLLSVDTLIFKSNKFHEKMYCYCELPVIC